MKRRETYTVDGGTRSEGTMYSTLRCVSKEINQCNFNGKCYKLGYRVTNLPVKGGVGVTVSCALAVNVTNSVTNSAELKKYIVLFTTSGPKHS